jgi:hypothetical protein
MELFADLDTGSWSWRIADPQLAPRLPRTRFRRRAEGGARGEFITKYISSGQPVTGKLPATWRRVEYGRVRLHQSRAASHVRSRAVSGTGDPFEAVRDCGRLTRRPLDELNISTQPASGTVRKWLCGSDDLIREKVEGSWVFR